MATAARLKNISLDTSPGRADRTAQRTPDQMTVADVLDRYGTEHAVPSVKDPARDRRLHHGAGDYPWRTPRWEYHGRDLPALWQGTRPRTPGKIRRELGTLAAAINYCHAEGYLTVARKVRLPAKPPSRDRWLTRDEAARLLRAAYRNPKAQHLARFVLVALHTGTRSDAIMHLQFVPNTQGGWVNTEAGMM